ncbi:MAG: ribosome-binding factor A [Candidatus Cloacimonetes bacterium]|nr:ribosome-binding factor A [Candidatus Cloacimonadota bacterium]
MKNYRIPRLQEELKKIFNITLTQKLNDPSLDWVTITDVVLSKDLRYAKLYFSHYNNPASHEEILERLIISSGFLKTNCRSTNHENHPRTVILLRRYRRPRPKS